MKSRNFRPKQIAECEAHLAIAYHKCQKYEQAHNYFMNSDYKSKNLNENILWSFICCGIDNMEMLNNKEDQIQLYKLKAQFGSNCTENHVNVMIDLFELDWELFKHEDLEFSPYFNEVLKSIERVKKDWYPDPDYPDYLYIDFSLIILKVGVVSDWIPKLLLKYDYENHEEASHYSQKFKYQYCLMKYNFLRGENLQTVRHGMMAKDLYDKDADVQEDYDPDNNMGE